MIGEPVPPAMRSGAIARKNSQRPRAAHAAARRDSLLNVFAADGARYAISSTSPIAAAGDSSWTAINGVTWLRKLGP